MGTSIPPSATSTLFELVYGFTIIFQVYSDKDGVHMPSLSEPVSKNYFDFASESHYCAEYEFVIEAVTNISHEHARQNSSAVGVLMGGKFYLILKCVALNHNFACTSIF